MIRINEHLDYEAGKTFWSHDIGGSSGKRLKAGTRAGSLDTSTGYWRVWLNGKLMMEHRIILEAFLGRALFPGFEIDHINRVRDDNRALNLRETSRRTNHLNNGAKGISPNGNGWQAKGVFDGKKWHKYFPLAADARAYWEVRHASDLVRSLELDAEEIRRLEKRKSLTTLFF